ncbi:MAG: hypothetical protein WCD86_20160 [Ktedonobacteraceae bacterium]
MVMAPGTMAKEDEATKETSYEMAVMNFKGRDAAHILLIPITGDRLSDSSGAWRRN